MKRYITPFGILILITHFSLILIYCFPQYFSNSNLLGLSKRYVFPVFNQNWQMFAPEPPMGTRKLHYRCIFEDGAYSEWIDPGKAVLRQHQANRFGHYGKLFNIYESIHRELKYLDSNVKFLIEKDLVKKDSLYIERNKRILTSPQYKMAARYLIDHASQYFKHKKILDIEFMYVASTLPGINNKSAEITYEVILFPTINFANESN